MFRYRNQLRRWAAWVLLLWLFGVGSGVANACMASNPAESGAPHDDTVAHHHALVPPLHVEGDADHPILPGKANCQDFCGKAGVSIPPLKSVLDGFHGPAFLPTVIATAVPAPPLPALQLWVPRREGVRAPPIPIAFLRLTL